MKVNLTKDSIEFVDEKQDMSRYVTLAELNSLRAEMLERAREFMEMLDKQREQRIKKEY